MKKRLLSTLLALCMVLALLPVAALAADSDFVIENGVLVEYTGSGGAVTIPNGVTEIGDVAFAYCEGLTSITIPSSVTTIGGWAFMLSGLTSVIIPDGVTTLGVGAFASCESLTSVTIPTSVALINYAAFLDCNKLKDVYYNGSKGQWDQISIDAEENEPLFNAAIHYSSASSSGSGGAAPSGISVTVGGKAVAWTDAAPFIDANSRTMVPLRAVADAMNLTVNWDGGTREASFSNGSKTIYFPIDSNSARTSGGAAVQMDTAAVIANERTYAPIRYLAEYFGYTVGWDAATQTVGLTK